MQRVFYSILLSFAVALIGNNVLADDSKIDLGDGKVFEKALSGERIRVQVDFTIPAAEIPDGVDGFAIRRNMVKNTRVLLLDQVFGSDKVVDVGASRVNTVNAKSASTGPSLVRKLDNVPSMAMMLTISEMELLAADPSVTRIYQDALSRPNLAESTVLVGAPVLWDAGNEGSGVAVAVLDTGVDHGHAMISGRVTGSACFSSGFGTRTSSFCPDGTNAEISANAGTNCPMDDLTTPDVNEAIDGCFHGTHVASIAMGGELFLFLTPSLYGVARQSDLLAIQVFTQFNDADDCDPDGDPPAPESAPCTLSFSSDQRAGLDYVINNAASLNVAAVNMSLGGGDEITNAAICDVENSSMKSLIDQLRTLGVATVIASGNESYNAGVSSPGCISTAITVGSTTKADAVSSFSNSSELVDLLAPGSRIEAATPRLDSVSNWVRSSGTSMAAPHVAGAFALLRSAHPGASVQDIEDALEATGTPINDGRANSIIKPRIRIDLASDLLASGGVGLGSVALTPVSGFLASGDLVDPGNFTTKVYTLTNNGTVSANFTVAGDKNWLGFSATSGSIPPNGGTATVTVSVVVANVSSGQTDSGVITFTVGGNTTTRGASLNVASPLLNDDFADAFPLTGITVSTSGTNVGAGFEAGEVEHNSEFTDTGGSSVWFKWTAPLSDNFTVSTEGTNFDTVMSVYTGTGVTALTFIAGNDDAAGAQSFSRTSFDAVAGTTYHIVIDGFNGSSGLYDLALSPTNAPGSDNFANASAISTASGSISTNSINASAEAGEPAHAGQTATHSVWFNWTASSDGDFTFHTDGSSFDTVLAIYTGAAVNALTEVGSNDNQGSGTPGSSRVTFTATNATSYMIAVDGASATSGLVKLSWFSNAVAQPNLVTAVLPNARSVLVGQEATAFMTVINAGGDGTNCQLSLPNTNFVGGFTYQATDAINQTIGSPNTSVSIAGSNGVQNFIFGVTPSTNISAEVLTPLASCDEGTSSSVTTGVNTFTLSSASIQPADMLTIGLTISGNGVIEMQSAVDGGFMVIATAAIGSGATLTLSVNDGGAGLPLLTSVCETDPVTSVCLATPSNSVTFNSVNGETRTFAAFVTATGDIPFAPGDSRLFVTFDDADGVSRGGSSVAVRTDFVPASEAPSVVAGLD